MPRTPRVEYENAVYHVMARGNRREPIVHDDGDRQLFLDTLDEACGRTGWRVFAWVLMDNHYHAVFRTPEPNLVAGMQWFQSAYTRRLNARRHFWGHLFGGRYKAIPIEDESTSPRSRLAGPTRDHGERRAREILAEAAAHYGIDEAALREDRRGDWRRASVAWAVAKETSVPHAWIAEKLNLKSAANASQQIRRFHRTPVKELPREVKQWKLSRNVA